MLQVTINTQPSIQVQSRASSQERHMTFLFHSFRHTDDCETVADTPDRLESGQPKLPNTYLKMLEA